MATIYVSSVDGNDADNGSTWDLANATIAGGLTDATDATNIIYVDSAHAETPGSAITWNTGNTGRKTAIISVNRTTGVWEVGAKASCQVSGGAFNIMNTSYTQAMYLWGITMESTTGASSGSTLVIGNTSSSVNLYAEFVNCTLSNPGTGDVYIGVGTFNSQKPMSNFIFRDCTFKLKDSTSNAGIKMVAGKVQFYNMTVAYNGANKPSVLFNHSAPAIVEVADSDLTGFNANNYISAVGSSEMVLRNCKLHATPGIVGGTFTGSGSVTVINCDSGDTKTVFEYRNLYGTITESTSIYADDGAKFDGAGISWEIVTTADCNDYTPFITPWLHRWSDDTAQITVEFKVVHDSLTGLNDQNLWSNIEYVSDASFPKGTLVQNRNELPFEAGGVDWDLDSTVWTGTGGFTDENLQKISNTFTPAEKSLIRGRLFVGIASKTFYLDPLLRIA